MESFRSQQVAELIKSELGQMLLREIDWPTGTLVTITFVKVTKDLRQARVGISVLPFARRFVIMEKLKRERSHLQDFLFERLEMKPVPRLAFTIDRTEEKAAVIEELLDKSPQ